MHDEAEGRLDKTGDEENQEEAKANDEGGKEVAEERKLPEIKSPKDKEELGEEIKLPKEEEKAKAKHEGGKEMGEEGKIPEIKSPKDEEGDTEVSEEIKLHENKSLGNKREYNKRKKEEFVRDEAKVHPVHCEKGNEEEAKAKEERDTKVVKEVQVTKDNGKAEAKDEGGKEVCEEIKLNKTKKSYNQGANEGGTLTI